MKIKSILYWPVFWLVARFLRWHTNMVVGKAFKKIQNIGDFVVPSHCGLAEKFMVVAWGSSSLFQMCRAFNGSIVRYKNREEEKIIDEFRMFSEKLRLMLFWRSYPEIELKKGRAFCVRARLAIAQVTKEFYEDVK